MLLKIDFNENHKVIFKSDTRIILEIPYYSGYAVGPHLATVRGSTLDDFRKNGSASSKTIFIGQRGGITTE